MGRGEGYNFAYGIIRFAIGLLLVVLSKPQLNVTSTEVGFDIILTLHNNSAPAQPTRQELKFGSNITTGSRKGARMG